MPDTKKLITGFLALAVLTSSFAIGLSYILSGKTNKSTNSPENLAIVKQNTVPAPRNVFVEQVPTRKIASTKGAVNNDQNNTLANAFATNNAGPSDNLTENLLQRVTQEMVLNNPNGPQVDATGATSLNLPTEDYVAQLIRENAAKSVAQIEKIVTEKDFYIAETYSAEDLSTYTETVNKAISRTVANKNFISLFSKTPSDENINSARLVLENTVADLSLLSVPRPLAQFHAKLLTFFSNQEQIFKSLRERERDPLRAIVILEGSGEIIDRNLRGLEVEMEKVSSLSILPNKEAEASLAQIFQNVVGVKKAHALFFSFVFDPANLSQAVKDFLKDIKNWIYDTLVNVFINQIINRMQNMAVNWISNGANPRFVSSWGDFLGDAFNEAAGATIQRVVPGICSPFQPVIRVQLNRIYGAAELRSGCTLEDIVDNITDFYSDFSNGGWVAYGHSISPSNNYYGSLFFTAEQVGNELQTRADAARNEAVASQGFLSVKRCPTESGSEEVSPTTGLCSDGSPPIIVTPGTAVSHSLENALNWKPSQIVNTRRLFEVFQVILDSALNKVIETGLRSVSSFANENGGVSESGDQGGDALQDLAESLADTLISSLDSTISLLNSIRNDLNCTDQWNSANNLSQQANNLKTQVLSLRQRAQSETDFDRLEQLLDQLSDTSEEASIISTQAETLQSSCQQQTP